MRQFSITGMSCAACSARVEKAVNAVAGVTSCSVSLLTSSMGVEGTATDRSIIEAVEKAGYGASKIDNKVVANSDEFLKDRESPLLIKRLIVSLFFWLILLYISMGHRMFNLPLPEFIAGNYVAMGALQLVITTIIVGINQNFFKNGIRSLIKGSPNMDTLVAMGAGAAYIYSLASMLLIYKSVKNGDISGAITNMGELYFESTGTILTLITVGKTLEAKAKGKTTDAIKSLLKLSPNMATVIRNNKEVRISVDEVIIGDIFVVKSGESIPVDGIVTEGTCAVDESALSGESIPIDKQPDSSVYAATINKTGFIKCKATRVGEDTTLSQIIKLMSEASATKAPIAKIADKVSGAFVPSVLAIAVLTFILWMVLGKDISFSMSRAIAVLVISCPCALGLATPVAIMVASGIGVRNQILFKTAVSLEEIAKVQTVILDKTGTITSGKPRVTDVISDNVNELLRYAGTLEIKSEHPLALAVNEYVSEKEVVLSDSSELKIMPGNGLKAIIQGRYIYGGNTRFIEKYVTISNKYKGEIDRLSNEGKTPIIFSDDKNIIGIIAVADTVKEDSILAINELKNMGIRVVMLTGDNEKTAKAIGKQVNVDEIIAGVLPDEKENTVRRFRKNGKVAMVGDGVNDAPALVSADVGIAIGAGADIAIDAADIVLVKSKLIDIPATIRLGRMTLKNIKENLFWAFIYNIICIPLAAGIWYPLFGIKLNPVIGAVAMSLSSFFVVTNALRLNLFNIYNSKGDKKIKYKYDVEEKEYMEKKMYINGMMCGHCEARVKKVLEALPEVDEAIVSHEEGTAIIRLVTEISNESLIKIITDEGYEVSSIK